MVENGCAGKILSSQGSLLWSETALLTTRHQNTKNSSKAFLAKIRLDQAQEDQDEYQLIYFDGRVQFWKDLRELTRLQVARRVTDENNPIFFSDDPLIRFRFRIESGKAFYFIVNSYKAVIYDSSKIFQILTIPQIYVKNLILGVLGMNLGEAGPK